jgi:hypothetical protein
MTTSVNETKLLISSYLIKNITDIPMTFADRIPAYLENSNPRNTPFYERFGFEPLGVIKAGTVPEIVPMLRKPRERSGDGAPRAVLQSFRRLLKWSIQPIAVF